MMSRAKADEPIEMPFGGGQTRMAPRNHVADGGTEGTLLSGNIYGPVVK